MRKKFKIIDAETNKPYKPPDEHMVVMNSGGIFFLVYLGSYYPSIQPLANVLPRYNVIWRN